MKQGRQEKAIRSEIERKKKKKKVRKKEREWGRGSKQEGGRDGGTERQSVLKYC